MRAVHAACLRIFAIVLVLAVGMSSARAQCPPEPTLQNYTGGGASTCPCFVAGEQAGAVLDAPAAHYPIEILRVGIGWGSQLGGTPQTQEQAIHVYSAGLPNPGTPIFTLPGPLLSDGSINEYNLEPYAGEIVVSGPFTVTLEFTNSNAGDIFAASVVHDGNGCQPGKNVVEANPGGWNDACALGVTGDWVFYVVYRRTGCAPTDAQELIATSSTAFLLPPQPNPTHGRTRFEFVLPRDEQVHVAVYDVGGRLVANLADRTYAAGRHAVEWNATGAVGALPPGVYVVQMQAGDVRSSRKLVLAP